MSDKIKLTIEFDEDSLDGLLISASFAPLTVIASGVAAAYRQHLAKQNKLRQLERELNVLVQSASEKQQQIAELTKQLND